jgi:type II secretory pathway component PulF
VNFCRQFANYLDAGVNLTRSMESLRRQYDRTALGPVIGRLQLAVRRGEALTDAMGREPAVFDHFFLCMMRVAEVRGAVPEMLRMLSIQLDARQRLVRQAKSALVYPAFVVFLSIAVAALLTILILPTLVAVMEDLVRRKHIELPWPTQLLMQLSDFIVRLGWWAIPACLFGSAFALVAAYKTRPGKAVIDEVLLRLPIVGFLVRWIDTTRFARTLASLLEAGVDIGSSLNLTADTLLLTPLRRAVLRAREGIMEGETLSTSVGVSNRFPADLIAIMNSAEETGRLPEMLMMIADEYQEKVDYTVKNLGGFLQPVVILIVGSMVGFIAVSFLMGYTAIIADLGSK